MGFFTKLGALAALPLVATAAVAQGIGDIRVEFVHGNQTDLSFTPLWFGFHNGGFDTFNTGTALTVDPADTSLLAQIGRGVESIAEVGQVGLITSAFTNAPGIPGDVQGVAAAAGNGVPPIEPGETGVGFATPVNPSNYQFFSFLSMVVPTNDTFIGNSDPLAFRVFNDLDQLIDANGVPTSVREIEVRRFYDAGTELDGGPGAAFQQGVDGALGTSTSEPVSLFPSLAAFSGVTDVTGRVISDVLTGTESELIGTIRISIVPEPSTLVLGAVGLLGLRRRG